MAVMAVPETSVYKYDGPVFWQDDIRLSRELLDVEPETQASCMQGFSDQEFRSSVLALDVRHHAASGLFANNVSHFFISTY